MSENVRAMVLFQVLRRVPTEMFVSFNKVDFLAIRLRLWFYL